MSDAAMTNDLPARVVVLDEIARGTKATLERIERRLDTVASEQRTDYRWLLGLMLGGNAALLGIVAHGFHWI